MPLESPSTERKAHRLELLVVYVLCVALLGAMGLLWLQQNGYFGSAPVVSHDASARVEKPIEINSAEWWELTEISGIGEVRAKAIVALRARKKRFENLDELKEIRGITSKIIERMRAVVRISPPADDKGKQR